MTSSRRATKRPNASSGHGIDEAPPPDRQAQAIADGIVDKVREEAGVKPLLVEGTSRWILVDYGDLIVHIFTEETRRFYGLERLWGDAPDVTSQFVEEKTPANAAQQ